ncbi:unnamed protein product [Vitrella brassicaformis CCMP3155]|uniref:Uncharacterized protein n=2 Tax=Vitrella brassicaformis TaxID=1169539 RepID=A0A0G4GA29_VITBC|nr:unnamed protein product [Vitrella brassicaformis CCMP3155]|eukprot:CEM25712.1 unnamed protein product [Vitrella brassicaformis CCMP3155]
MGRLPAILYSSYGERIRKESLSDISHAYKEPHDVSTFVDYYTSHPLLRHKQRPPFNSSYEFAQCLCPTSQLAGERQAKKLNKRDPHYHLRPIIEPHCQVRQNDAAMRASIRDLLSVYQPAIRRSRSSADFALSSQMRERPSKQVATTNRIPVHTKLYNHTPGRWYLPDGDPDQQSPPDHPDDHGDNGRRRDGTEVVTIREAVLHPPGGALEGEDEFVSILSLPFCPLKSMDRSKPSSQLPSSYGGEGPPAAVTAMKRPFTSNGMVRPSSRRQGAMDRTSQMPPPPPPLAFPQQQPLTTHDVSVAARPATRDVHAQTMIPRKENNSHNTISPGALPAHSEDPLGILEDLPMQIRSLEPSHVRQPTVPRPRTGVSVPNSSHHRYMKSAFQLRGARYAPRHQREGQQRCHEGAGEDGWLLEGWT